MENTIKVDPDGYSSNNMDNATLMKQLHHDIEIKAGVVCTKQKLELDEAYEDRKIKHCEIDEAY